MSSISGISSSISSSLYGSVTRASKKGNESSMAETLFAQLDTTGKGYLEKTDLVSAFSQLSSSSSNSSSSLISSTSSTSSESASAEDVFAKLDGDSDGKVTEDELASGLEALAATLDNQFNQMRMSGAMPPPPPPPSAQNDSGFTQEELETQLSEIDSTDSARSDLLTKIVNNFDAADTDTDGKVSFQEAMAYDESTKTSASTAASDDGGFTLAQLKDQVDAIGSSDSTRSDLINKIVSNFDTADTDSDGKVNNAEAMAYEKSTSSTTSSTSTTSTTSSDQAILKRIMELMDSYASTSSTQSSTLSVSA